MRTDGCREWRTSLGAYALGQLPVGERAAIEAHLEGCPECRAEVETFAGVARLMPLADPDRVMTPAPQPPPELGERIAATIGGERREREERSKARRRRRFGFAFGGVATAAAAALLAIVLIPGGGDSAPHQRVAFGDLPQGVEIDARLEPHAFGTEIEMYVSGVRSGTLCRVFLEGSDGRRYPAGSFRYRYGDDADAVLSSALDLSRTRAIGVRAGERTFVAPVDATEGGESALIDSEDEEAGT